MEINNTIDQIIKLPEKYYNFENISIYSLLQQTGYFTIYDQVNEANILNALLKQPEAIDQWLIWSENKRTSSGWYLKQSNKGKYVVGFFPRTAKLKSVEYAGIEKACAHFIKCEIEEIRKSI